jgi:hypothetical protein
MRNRSVRSDLDISVQQIIHLGLRRYKAEITCVIALTVRGGSCEFPADRLRAPDDVYTAVVEGSCGTLKDSLCIILRRSYEDLYRYNFVDGPGGCDKGGRHHWGAVGVLRAIAGLYGLVAYNVSRRTREIGIRMALGAGPSDVLRLVMGKCLVLVGMGTAIGLAMGFGARAKTAG